MDSENISIFLFGVNTGFWCLGLLFYIIQLTGSLVSLTSILYLFTIFSFGLTSVFTYLVEVNLEGYYAYIYQICAIIFANGSVSYFGILVLNTYKVLERRWLYIICFLPLPMAIAVNLWCLQDTLKSFKIEIDLNSYALSVTADILIVFTELMINIVCYLKFCKFKNIPGFKSLLAQYLSGIIFTLLLDVLTRVISIYLQLNERSIVQISIASGYINLNLEFFLLNRIRMVLMSHIIMHNS